MQKSSKLVGLVLLSSTAFLAGCGGGDRTGNAQGSYTDSNGIHHYGGRSSSWFGGSSSSSSSSRGGFGATGHGGGSGGGGE